MSETYTKKLVSRTIDAMIDFSKNRLAVCRRIERKNGLEYTERRVILPTDATIPGETSKAKPTEQQDPETAGVLG